jgi:ABC-type nitrate/sulfonate/bicarbonate transport system substrate-binding protein
MKDQEKINVSYNERRKVMKKKAIMMASLGFLLSIFVSAPVMAQALKKVKVVIPRNSVFMLSYFAGRDAGIWRKRGIDLVIDARPFKGYAASLPAKEVFVTTYMGTAAIARINKGMDLVVVGGGLTVMQEVFVRKDSPFKTMDDLRGKKFASWSTGAGAFKATRAAIMDGFEIDVLKDTEFKQAAAPALIKLLDRGDVDSMFNISSLTIAAAAQPDKYRSIFVPNDYWKKKTGYPIVWSAPIVAWRSWVDEDPERAKNHVEATMESFRWLRKGKNLDAAVKKYGKSAAVKNKAQAETYKSWLKQGKVFMTKWDQEVIDSQWEFLKMAKKRGALTKIPSKKKHGLILN